LQLPGAILVSAGVGKGKSTSCLYVLGKARSRSIRVGGIISPRKIVGDELVGYDGLDCVTGEVFPLAALAEASEGPDWRRVGQIRYAFSRKGFSRANSILRALASEPRELMFVDEVGRLEMAGEGLFPGVKALADSPAIVGSVLVFSCRLEALDWAEGLIGEHIPRVRWSPGEPEELWGLVRDRLP